MQCFDRTQARRSGTRHARAACVLVGHGRHDWCVRVTSPMHLRLQVCLSLSLRASLHACALVFTCVYDACCAASVSRTACSIVSKRFEGLACRAGTRSTLKCRGRTSRICRRCSRLPTAASSAPQNRATANSRLAPLEPLNPKSPKALSSSRHSHPRAHWRAPCVCDGAVRPPSLHGHRCGRHSG